MNKTEVNITYDNDDKYWVVIDTSQYQKVGKTLVSYKVVKRFPLLKQAKKFCKERNFKVCLVRGIGPQ